MSNRNISKELQDTVRSNPSISKVYFDASGNHWLYVHLLPTGKNGSEEAYGGGEFSHTQVIPGLNEDKIKEHIAKGNQQFKIVEEVDRDYVLEFKVRKDNSELINSVVSMSIEDKRTLLASLLPPEVLSKIMNLGEEKADIEPAKPPAKPPVK